MRKYFVVGRIHAGTAKAISDAQSKFLMLPFYSLSVFTPRFSGTFYILLHKKRISPALVMRFPRFFTGEAGLQKLYCLTAVWVSIWGNYCIPSLLLIICSQRHSLGFLFFYFFEQNEILRTSKSIGISPCFFACCVQAIPYLFLNWKIPYLKDNEIVLIVCSQ